MGQCSSRECDAVGVQHRLGRGHPLRAALPRAVRDRARPTRPARDGAAAAALRRRADRTRRSGAAVAAGRDDAGPGGRGAGAARRARDSLDEAALRGDAARPLPARPAARRSPRCSTCAAAGPPPRDRTGPAQAAAGRAATRRWSPASRRGRRRGGALGRGRLLDLQAEARRRRRLRPGARRARGGRAARRGSGSTPTPPGTWRRRSGRSPPWSRSRSSSPSSRWRRWRRRRRWRQRPRSRSPATRASRAAPTPSGPYRIGACALTGREALQGRRAGGGDRDRRGAARPTSPAPSTGRSGSRRPRRWRRRWARRAGDEGARPRPRPRHPAPLRLDHRLGRVRAARRDAPPARRARAWAWRSTRQRSQRIESRSLATQVHMYG